MRAQSQTLPGLGHQRVLPAWPCSHWLPSWFQPEHPQAVFRDCLWLMMTLTLELSHGSSGSTA